MKIWRHELKLALAALLRVPGFALTVIMTLAITLGALICIFSLNNLLLVKPLPYPNAERLLVVNQTFVFEGEVDTGSQTVPGMLLWYQQQSQLSQMALLLDSSLNIVSHPDQPNINVNYVTHEYFSLLQPAMHLGRPMGADEGFNRQQPVAVLSYHSWLTWYGGKMDIIGSKTRLGDVSYKIIGVTAKDFFPPKISRSDGNTVWLPWDFQPMDTKSWGRQMSSLMGLGMLKDGVSMAQATAAMSQLINDEYQTTEVAEANEATSAALLPIKQVILGDSRQIALLLLGGVVGLLLIATTNVTNLFLSRAAQKQRTMAIQAALGAKPAQLFTSMFAESLLLCGVAGLLGLLVAGWGFILLQELAARQLPRMAELGLDVTTVIFTVLMVFTLAAVFAKLSSRVINYDKLQAQLQSSGKGSGLQISSRTRNILIATQVTLATVLLVAASVVVQQAVSTAIHPLGFNEKQVLHFRLDRPKGYEGEAALNVLTTQIKNRLIEMPQVLQATRSLVPAIYRGRLRRDLQDMDSQRLGAFGLNQVDPNYFDLLELPLLQGSTFTAYNNDEQEPDEIIISQSMAHYLAPQLTSDGNMVGKFVHEGDLVVKVVGVVKDYYNPVQTKPEDYRRYYRPFSASWLLGFDIKLAEGAELSKQTLLQLLHEIDPKLRILSLLSHSERHQNLIYRHKLAAGLTIVLGILALILAAAGIYGVLNYSTQMRRYELGIHLALGAKTGLLMKMVLKESFRPVLQGLVSSAVVVMAIYFVAWQWFAMTIPLDIVTILIALCIMLAVACLACYLPVKKVIMDDPVKALRNE